MLRDLQEQLAVALSPSDDGGVAIAVLLGELATMPRLSPTESLEIYRRSTANAVAEALSEIYPVCAELVGDECFRSTVRLYRGAHPSRNPDLARIGDAWPEFVAGQSFLAGVPYLADVARVELALHHAYSASSGEVLEDIASVVNAIVESPEAWRFKLAPGAALIESNHPILAIWEAHRGDRAVDRGWKLDPEAEGECVMVWRRGLEVCADRVDAQLRLLVRSIFEGESVSTQISMLAESTDADLNSGDFRPILDTMEALFAKGWVRGGQALQGSS